MGTVFVTTTCSMGASSSDCCALPLKMPWVAPTKIGPAPWAASACAPLATVPAVSIMSSTMHARPALDLTDDRHLLDLVRLLARAALVEERQVRVQVLAQLLGGLDATGVGRHYDEVVAVQAQIVLQVVREDRAAP